MKFRNDKLIDIYSDLLRKKDDNLSGMIVLLKIMMTVSVSTAACEWFSCMDRQKENIWTSLSHLLLDNVMQICIDDCEVKQFDAEKNVNHWMDIANGVRHIKSTKHYPKKGRLTMVKLLLFK